MKNGSKILITALIAVLGNTSYLIANITGRTTSTVRQRTTQTSQPTTQPAPTPSIYPSLPSAPPMDETPPPSYEEAMKMKAQSQELQPIYIQRKQFEEQQARQAQQDIEQLKQTYANLAQQKNVTAENITTKISGLAQKVGSELKKLKGNALAKNIYQAFENYLDSDEITNTETITHLLGDLYDSLSGETVGKNPQLARKQAIATIRDMWNTYKEEYDYLSGQDLKEALLDHTGDLAFYIQAYLMEKKDRNIENAFNALKAVYTNEDKITHPQLMKKAAQRLLHSLGAQIQLQLPSAAMRIKTSNRRPTKAESWSKWGKGWAQWGKQHALATYEWIRPSEETKQIAINELATLELLRALAAQNKLTQPQKEMMDLINTQIRNHEYNYNISPLSTTKKLNKGQHRLLAELTRKEGTNRALLGRWWPAMLGAGSAALAAYYNPELVKSIVSNTASGAWWLTKKTAPTLVTAGVGAAGYHYATAEEEEEKDVE